MSDEIDIALDDLLGAPLPHVSDDGFSTGVLVRISEAELARSQTVMALLAAASCVLFALVGGLALSQPAASPAGLLPAAISIAVASLVLSFSVHQLFQE